MPFPPTFTDVWDHTTPPDTQLANLLGQDIRNLKLDIEQRMSLLSGTLANRPTPEIVNAVWGGSGFGITYFATDTKQIFQWNNSTWVELGYSLPSIGGALLNPVVTSETQFWKAPFACTVTSVKAHCTNGTSVVYSIKHSGVASIVDTITVNASAANADYTDAGAVSQASMAVGDRLGLIILTVNGAVTDFSFQVNLTRP